MHQGVAAQPLPRTPGIKSRIGAQQRDGDAREQGRIGGQPDRHLVGEQEGADRRRRGETGQRVHAAACQKSDAERGDERVQKIGQARRPRRRAELRDGGARNPIGERRLFAERLARQQRNRLIRLPAHAPRKVRLARLVRSPVAAPQDADAPDRAQCGREHHHRGARRAQQSSILGGLTRSAHGIC